MKRKTFGPAFGENIEKSARTSGLLDEDALIKATDWTGSQETNLKLYPISNWRLLPFYLLSILAFLTLLTRAFSLQVIQGSSFLEKAEGNHVRVVVDHAPRGAILDRNGKILATSKPGFRLVVDPTTFPADSDQALTNLAKLAGLTKEEISKRLEQNQDSNSLVTLKDNVEQAVSLSLASQKEKYLGVEVLVSPQREYFYPLPLAPVIGYTSEVSKEDLAEKEAAYKIGDKVGRSGAEKTFEARLRGANGYELEKVDALGTRQGSLLKTKSLAGSDVSLSIDLDLQLFAYETLLSSVKSSRGHSGAVVVQNPKTGEVLALVSYPSYDNNLFAKGLTQKEFGQLFKSSTKPLLNRAIATALPPGSTFKLFVAASGLEEKAIDAQTKILDTGFIRLGTVVYNNWLWRESARTEGEINLVRALARSNDTYFFRLGQKLGEEKIGKYARLFGFGEKAGIELPEEIVGLVPTPEWKLALKGEVWYPGETLNIAIGQGDLLVTPLQLNVATSVFANGGKLIRPTLLPNPEPDIVRQDFVSSSSLVTVKEGMVANQKGDGNVGWLFSGFGVSTAGKTGSAEAGGDKNSHAWFTAFAPVDVPKIVVTVMVENGGHGSEVSAPVAKKIFAWWFKNRH